MDTTASSPSSRRTALAVVFVTLVLVALTNQRPVAQAPARQVQSTTVVAVPPQSAAAAPAPADPSRRFEVASVKRNSSGENFIRIGMQPGGRYTATNVPLSQLITQAYQLQRFQLIGGPDWIRSDRFDISAKAEGEVQPTPPGTAGAIQMMVRNLLADRFKLVVHEEERDLPIYALVLAREDKRLGPKLQSSTVDCQALMREAAAAGRGGAPPPAPGQRPFCGMQMGNGTLRGSSFAMSQLPNVLAPIVQRYVVDRTGLTGNFDIDLTFTPEQIGGGGAGAAPGVAPAPDMAGASIFTALQEQLGLKLESSRGPVKVLVIDSVQPPTED